MNKKTISHIRTFYGQGNPFAIAIVRDGCIARVYSFTYRNAARLAKLNHYWKITITSMASTAYNPFYVRSEQ